jgi:putative PIN family toxin of toxin-antitoxin system
VRLVLDTNVLIAAFAARGLCHSILELCIDRHEVFLSEALLAELRGNLARKLKLPEEQQRQIEAFLVEIGHVESPKPLAEAVCRDPDDDLILALAQTVAADVSAGQWSWPASPQEISCVFIPTCTGSFWKRLRRGVRSWMC